MNTFKLKTLAACLLFTQAAAARAEDLLTIYQQALGADPDSKSAALNVEITKEQTGEALGEMLPQVSGSAN
ncbi:MAG TPA: type I secretion protein TolC, partial [Methylococcaceae bacterium]|nr:type I secretion protein TolC [Methylococcaceae bacterium]